MLFFFRSFFQQEHKKAQRGEDSSSRPLKQERGTNHHQSPKTPRTKTFRRRRLWRRRWHSDTPWNGSRPPPRSPIIRVVLSLLHRRSPTKSASGSARTRPSSKDWNTRARTSGTWWPLFLFFFRCVLFVASLCPFFVVCGFTDDDDILSLWDAILKRRQRRRKTPFACDDQGTIISTLDDDDDAPFVVALEQRGDAIWISL